MNDAFSWWQHGVIYEVYPRSFLDSDGDGVGDLQGIRAKIDYLSWLGITALWLTPIYRSPMKDFGYDVADYCDVDPAFGAPRDLEQLSSETLARAGPRWSSSTSCPTARSSCTPGTSIAGHRRTDPEARLVHLRRPRA